MTDGECQERFALRDVTGDVTVAVLGCALMPGHDGSHWDERGVSWSAQEGVVPLLGYAMAGGGRIDALSPDVSAEGLLRGPLIDPDCRDGKHGSCAADPCDCPCHHAVEVVGSLPGVDLVSLDGSHVHYYRQTTAGLACSCGATVTT